MCNTVYGLVLPSMWHFTKMSVMMLPSVVTKQCYDTM